MRHTEKGFGRRVHRDRGEGRVKNHERVAQAIDDFLPETLGQRGGLAHGGFAHNDGDQIAGITKHVVA